MNHTTTCLVTGCAGFVGSHLTEALLNHGHPVIGVDDLTIGHDHNMATFAQRPGFTFRQACVTEPELIAGLLRDHPGLDHVFHLAAVVSVPKSFENPGRTMAVNFDATAALHAQSRVLGLSSFVFAGSAAEYGDDERLPLAEGHADDDTRQLSPYGRSKFLASRLIETSGYGVSLRCFNIYGARQSPDNPYSGVISKFAGRVMAGRPPIIQGDGGQTRDFVHVDDVLDVYLSMAGLHRRLRRPEPGIYNVGTGKGIAVLDLAREVMGLVGLKGEPEFSPARKGDIRHSVSDISRLRAATGFEPAVTFRRGLAQTLKWHRSLAGQP